MAAKAEQKRTKIAEFMPDGEKRVYNSIYTSNDELKLILRGAKATGMSKSMFVVKAAVEAAKRVVAK